MPNDPPDFTQTVHRAATELLAQASGGDGSDKAGGEVTSADIADHLRADRIGVEAALKHLAEQDLLTASFPTDGPAIVSEVS